MEYWQDLWRHPATTEAISRGDRFVVQETARVLPRGGRVVDAGCGIAATVHGLARAGFDAHGIDYAEETISTVRALHPDLQLEVADVRALPFDNGSLDGVWSLGVIEHFYEGFDPLIAEAHRVLRAGGYLFLTVPVISPLKAFKISLGTFPDFDETQREHFFQFAFRPQYVTEVVSG
ncbi:MAG: class I SAM-dependent methyltransferase, partial [Caldilineaceae bacterium]|nr:class I SAM-dependent methyltransferase [Caldilineaceae bacterium]